MQVAQLVEHQWGVVDKLEFQDALLLAGRGGGVDPVNLGRKLLAELVVVQLLYRDLGYVREGPSNTDKDVQNDVEVVTLQRDCAPARVPITLLLS